MIPHEMTKEPQYELLYQVVEQHGIASFGLMANESWNQDPKRTLFTLARYKFVAKLLSGKKSVLEVGCADAFGTRLVQQEVGHVTAVDFDPVFIKDAQSRANKNWPLTLKVQDMLAGPVPGTFDAAYSLDVLEHIQPQDEAAFMRNFCASVSIDAPVIIGMPSLESQAHASPQSKAGHVNCKTGKVFKSDLEQYFQNVFVFSMNDEVVHTGYYPMAHYLLALCCGKRT
ncbi:class I SAM-dependent methyltransferase [Rhodoferax saidenbachensis]|uniref:SAM-dependent methyltransferase n=1 Tax=Rhodoferax saidenbachensis TaxID=1484693 RepID=A0A1P8K6I5_9BURK|nr:class I SAM-dependent methyltransferase [Rhodoferax saidenbachensis]APW41613.1 SAM-dependent methyltransferase [Rhodoferax saidenbachensis]